MDDNPIFIEKKFPPSEDQMREALGPTYLYLEELIAFLTEKLGQVQPDWKFYSPKYGWTMKILHKKRNLCFISPRKNSFTLGFVFGDKAVAKIEKSSIPMDVIEQLVNARKYMEGRGIQFEIHDGSEIETLKKLFEYKIGK